VLRCLASTRLAEDCDNPMGEALLNDGDARQTGEDPGVVAHIPWTILAVDLAEEWQEFYRDSFEIGLAHQALEPANGEPVEAVEAVAGTKWLGPVRFAALEQYLINSIEEHMVREHHIHVWHSRAVPFEVSASWVVVGGKDEKCQAGGFQYPEAFGQTPFRILDVLKYIVGQNQDDRFASQREGLPESGCEGNGAWRNGSGKAGCGRNDSRIYFETYHMARN